MNSGNSFKHLSTLIYIPMIYKAQDFSTCKAGRSSTPLSRICSPAAMNISICNAINSTIIVFSHYKC